MNRFDEERNYAETTEAEPVAHSGETGEVRPKDQALTTLNAHDFQSLFQAAYDWLAHNYELVNRMNVFPVPDGDTGTNMLLTIKSAWMNISARSHETVSAVAAAAAEGAHHGSRGNSGVILGQILHGFSQALREKVTLNVQDMAEALRAATEAAYAAVPTPVEGTILTVSREISVAAESAAQKTRDLREFLAHIVEAADEAVRRTPDLLPVLKQAGVVDSGGKGLFFVFEGMYRALTGQPVKIYDAPEITVPAAVRVDPRGRKGYRTLPPQRWGFDVQFLIERPNKPVAEIAKDIAAMGECPLVEGDEHLVKVHVHVFDPGIPLSYGVSTGFVTDVVVENMDEMAAAMRGEIGQAETVPLGQESLDEETIGIVAVAPGPGFAEIFRQLGAQGVVAGGQSMNPSVAEIVDAVKRLPMRRIIVLPNNSNILMAAQQAAKAAANGDHSRQVVVVPTRTAPQGVAALTAYSPSITDIDALIARMSAQIEAVHTGEITQAVRSATVDGIDVQQGDFIGLHDGKLVSRGDHITDVALDLLEKMKAGNATLITLYYGDFVAEAAAQNFAEIVRREYPNRDIELAYGGQPHYYYILSIE